MKPGVLESAWLIFSSYTPWEKSLLANGTFENTDLPVLFKIRQLAQQERWITDEYLHLWQNDSGGSAVITDGGKAGLPTPSTSTFIMLT